jgi:hypothetical protein
MARNPDPHDLKDTLWHPVTDVRKAAQRAALSAAVRDAAGRSGPVIRARRRLSVVAVAAALLALPAGVALAAESALPGDPLYPVKQMTETVRSWVDDDIVAEHRVDELEALLAVDAPADRITDQVERAIEEVAQLDAGHRLRDRLSAVAGDRLQQGSGGGGADRPVDPPTTTTRPDQRDTTTTTRATTTTTTVDQTTTTTAGDRVTTRVLGRVLAGPTCPVERFPPDPDCEDQPVPGAILVVTDPQGHEKAVVESNEEGRFQLRLVPGEYVLVPQRYDGLLGTAPPQEFVVGAETVELLVRYDTGIR